MDGSRKNPLQKAHNINKIFFWWLKDIFIRGYKNDLSPRDIYDPMPEDLCEPLYRTLEIAWEKEKNNAKLVLVKPSLSRVLINTYYKTFLKLTTLHALYVIILMIQPYLMERILVFFDSKSNMSISTAYSYATLTIIFMAFQIIVLRNGSFRLRRLGKHINVAVSALIYKKITKLPCSSTSSNKSASAISLLSMDVDRFEILLPFLGFVVILPLQLLGVSYLVSSYVGLTATLIGVLLMILQTIPLQTLYYKLTMKWRAKQVSNTDKRISLIEEVVSGVRVIKMYAWENYFEKLVYHARSLEIQDFLKISYLRSVVDSFLIVSHRVCSFVATLIYFSQYGKITTAKMASIRQHFYYLRGNLSVQFFLGVQAIANTRVSIKRIEEFLLLPEVKSSIKNIEKDKKLGTILIKNVTASWGETTEDLVLQNINADFMPKKLYAILGPIASGKSTLLKLMLGELKPSSGQVSVSGEISYASQEPWLFAASVRENILFGETYDVDRYNDVTSACGLVHDFNCLPYGDETMVGDRGMSLSGGQCARINVARAVYRQADIYLLDDPFSAVDTRVGKMLRRQCIDGLLKDKTVILVTHNIHYLNADDDVVVLKSGKIQFMGNITDFQKKNDYLKILPPKEIDCNTSDLSDFLYYEKVSGAVMKKDDRNMAPGENQETIAKGTISKSIFFKYIQAGGFLGLLTALLAHALPIVLVCKLDYEMTAWTEQQTLGSNSSDIKTSGIFYNCISALVLIVATAIMDDVLMHKFVYSASEKLHNNMFTRLIRTPMQFFELNPAGRILNRFSVDISNLDNAMPESLVSILKAIYHVAGSLIFILIINWWNIIPITFTILLFIRMSHVYMTVFPKMKRLAGNAKSPVLNFVTSSLAGLTTIRSCKAENFVMKEFISRLDNVTAASFLVSASTAAFGLWIEILTVTLFGCTAYICVALKGNGTLGSETALTLTIMYEIISGVSYMARTFANTCSHMVHVERVLQYTELEPEDLSEEENSNPTAKLWPSRGEIKFKGVNLSYSDEQQPALKNLCFSIEPATKVGIVGRTGAGKSSLITALFRLAKINGQLLIDNVDTRKIDLSILRSKLSIIPQEPILFTATVRSNLDPLNEFSNDRLWSALDSVGLQKTFSSLDQQIERAGKNLSLGQRQLLCLARVAVKNNKILVLDEATANVDQATDAQIQATIKENFMSCTVLTVAHRLNTIIDNDKVIVMDHGQVVEYNHPHLLLQNQDGYFLKMVEQTGETMSQQLKKIAKNAYNHSKLIKS